jgi:hypothetical protein
MNAKKCFTSDDWLYLLRLLPDDLEASCRAKLAVERFREIRCASDLLRLCLAYGVCDLSLRQTAAWASTIGLGQLSNVAVLKRLRAAGDWLGHLMVQWLSRRGLTSQIPPRQVRIVDGSVVRTPGPHAQDYRLHLGFDLMRMRVADVELTPTSQGESLHHHIRGQGEVLLADRGYGKPPQGAAERHGQRRPAVAPGGGIYLCADRSAVGRHQRGSGVGTVPLALANRAGLQTHQESATAESSCSER